MIKLLLLKLTRMKMGSKRARFCRTNEAAAGNAAAFLWLSLTSGQLDPATEKAPQCPGSFFAFISLWSYRRYNLPLR